MQFDAANRDPFDSVKGTQKLGKAIAGHYVGHIGFNESPSPVGACPSELIYGRVNEYLNGEADLVSPEKGRGDNERIEMLEKEARQEKETRKVMVSAVESRKRFGFITAGLMGKIYM